MFTVVVDLLIVVVSRNSNGHIFTYMQTRSLMSLFFFSEHISSGLNRTPNIAKYKQNLKSCFLLAEKKMFLILENPSSVRPEHCRSGRVFIS